MSVEKLLREGLLKKIPPSAERTGKSLQVAAHYLDRAKKSSAAQLYDLAVLASYSAVFHAARAVLFADGFGERSHYAVCVYLREKHAEIGSGELSELDAYRSLRHSIAYGLDSIISEKDAEQAIGFAGRFLHRIRTVLKK